MHRTQFNPEYNGRPEGPKPRRSPVGLSGIRGEITPLGTECPLHRSQNAPPTEIRIGGPNRETPPSFCSTE